MHSEPLHEYTQFSVQKFRAKHWEHLEQLNEQFKKNKKSLVKLTAVPEDLGDEDILEMVNAGLLPVTVVNDWTAKLWSKLLPKMQVHSDIAIGPGVAFGWAVRKDSPKLLAEVNEFIKHIVRVRRSSSNQPRNTRDRPTC